MNAEFTGGDTNQTSHHALLVLAVPTAKDWSVTLEIFYGHTEMLKSGRPEKRGK